MGVAGFQFLMMEASGGVGVCQSLCEISVVGFSEMMEMGWSERQREGWRLVFVGT